MLTSPANRDVGASEVKNKKDEARGVLRVGRGEGGIVGSKSKGKKFECGVISEGCNDLWEVEK
jgi:hypothetical protein